jgi:hypothetical protein
MKESAETLCIMSDHSNVNMLYLSSLIVANSHRFPTLFKLEISFKA